MRIILLAFDFCNQKNVILELSILSFLFEFLKNLYEKKTLDTNFFVQNFATEPLV